MKNYKTLTTAYDVSGGDKNFDNVVFEGTNNLNIQFFFTSLNKADHKLRLQESVDGVNFVDSLDADDNIIEMVIDNTLTNDILDVIEFNTAHFRLQFIEGTAGTGTIDFIKILME